MGGFFGVASKDDCVFDLFYGTDYHSHLGTRRAGLVVYDRKKGFDRAIHNIESTNFRPKFEKEAVNMTGNIGIGSISDYEPQPLIVRSHLGTYALTTVGKINNSKEILNKLFAKGHLHFLEMSGGEINTTELVASMINQESTIADGIRYAQEMIDGSMSVLVMTSEGIYAARDRLGRTPVQIGKKPEAHCVCFDNFSYLNLEYLPVKELGPGEIVYITPEYVKTLREPSEEMQICTFLWIYYGFPASTYEGLNVEMARYDCGAKLAERDMERHPDMPYDYAAGVPDSGSAHSVGYSNRAGIPHARPFVKYTATWARSFMPTIQSRRDLIAHMKLLPVHDLIDGKRMILIDDSIVRGTQLRETTEFLYNAGAKEVHIRPACPPLVFGCKYLSFSRSNSELELIARRMIGKLEGNASPKDEILQKYLNPDSEQYNAMLEEIRKEMNFSSLHFHRLDDMVDAIGSKVSPCKLCTYCWSGKECYK